MLFRTKVRIALVFILTAILLIFISLTLRFKSTEPPISLVGAAGEQSMTSNVQGTSTASPDSSSSSPTASAPTTSPSAASTKKAGSTRQQLATQPKPTTLPSATSYPWHDNILTTVFWAGEDESADNSYIHNRSSAWMTDWVSAFGGVDNPDKRCGYNPCGFTPKENTFYFALPFGDYTESGPKSNLGIVPWYSGSLQNGQSILKNRWIEIRYAGKLAYAQWEDVGPFEDNDSQYVFGSRAPKQRVGLDVSPATRDYLGMGGQATVSWRFIEQSKVPAGPWKNKITASWPNW